MKPDFSYIYVMDEVVGEIPMLPVFNMATTSTVAKAFNGTTNEVASAYYRLAKEGDVAGVKMLEREDFLTAGYQRKSGATFCHGETVVSVTNNIRVFSKEAIFALAHKMTSNKKAKEIRNRIWNAKYNKASLDNRSIPIPDKEAVDVVKNPTGIGAMRVFSNDLFGDVRILDIAGEPWFAGKDVAIALGYSNSSKAVMMHVDDEDKRFEMLPVSDSQNGNLVKTAIINESGLYSLILSSKLPAAKDFKRWITRDVIPAIRKTGGYLMGEESMTDEELLAKAVIVSQNKIAERDKRIKELSKKNDDLTATNKALVGKVCEHEPRKIFRRLANAYGPVVWPWRSKGTQIRFAYGRFYREVSDKYRFDPNLRFRRAGEVGTRMDYIKEDEWPQVIQVAVALCLSEGIDVGKVLNSTNYKKYVT